MNLYSTLVFLHVASAILGLGPLTLLAVLASAPSPTLSAECFAKIGRIVGGGLGAMLVTGVAIMAQAHGAFGGAGWIKASVALFVALGALQGVVQRRLKRAAAAGAGAFPAGIATLLWAMFALVAAITLLMEAKPF